MLSILSCCLKLSLFVGSLWLSLSASAQAQGSGCNFTQVTGLNFGNYNVLNNAPTDGTGQFTLVCRGGGSGSFNNIPITISLSRGNSGSYTPRSMKFDTDSLNYNLYLDAGRTQIWGDGSGGSSSRGPFVPGNNVANTLEIYGRIFPGQWVSAGSYSDTIVITVQF